MADDDTDKKIAERLKSIFPDPFVAKKMIDVATSKRPPGWSRRSYAPYYKAPYAEWLRGFVDRMIRDKEQGIINSIIFRYDVFCTAESKKSEQTLYHQVNQAKHFLCDCMDTPENKYKQWDTQIRVSRDPYRMGVCIDWIPELLEGGIPAASLVASPMSKPLIDRQIDVYLESENYTPFVKENIALTPDDIQRISSSLAQLSNVMFDIKPHYIKIIKCKPE